MSLFQEDQYESLEIAYTSMTEIHIEENMDDEMIVTLSLTGPPRLGRSFVSVSERDGPSGAKVEASFALLASDEARWNQILRYRGMVSTSIVNLFCLANAIELGALGPRESAIASSS